jgi:hypothetical protein
MLKVMAIMTRILEMNEKYIYFSLKLNTVVTKNRYFRKVLIHCTIDNRETYLL